MSPVTFCPNPSFQLLYGRKRKRLEKTHEVENVKVENAKVENAKVENAKVENAKVENAKVENVKVENAKVKNAKVENSKVENVKVENRPGAIMLLPRFEIATFQVDNKLTLLNPTI